MSSSAQGNCNVYLISRTVNLKDLRVIFFFFSLHRMRKWVRSKFCLVLFINRIRNLILYC